MRKSIHPSPILSSINLNSPFQSQSSTARCGAGTTAILSRLSEARPTRVAWIESVVTLNPEVLSQFELSLSDFTFFESGPHAEWVLDEVMASALFPHIVYVPTQKLTSVRKEELLCKFKDRGLELMILESHMLVRPAPLHRLDFYRSPENNFDLATGS